MDIKAVNNDFKEVLKSRKKCVTFLTGVAKDLQGRLFVDTEGKITTIFLDVNDGALYEYHFCKGELLEFDSTLSKYDDILKSFLWAYDKCPYGRHMDIHDYRA